MLQNSRIHFYGLRIMIFIESIFIKNLWNKDEIVVSTITT